MARILPYERFVDAVLTQVAPARDTEIQNEVKIKEEPNDTTLNTDATEDYMLVKNYSNTITHDKTVNLKRKNSKINKEQVCDILSPPKKKRKFNEISFKENASTTIEDVSRRKKQSSTLDSETKIQYSLRSTKKKIFAECDICFREFSSLRNCEFHKQYYDAVGDYKCKICQTQYTTREKLHSHIMTCHHVYTVYMKFAHMYCHFCGRAFKSKEFLQSHLFHAHSELMYSGNIINCKRSNNVNTSRKDDTSKTNKKSIRKEYKESSCSSNPIKSEELNITLTNDGMSSTEKLRQPSLTEYLELCKKRCDIKPSPNKLNIMKTNFPMFALDHNGQTKENLKRKLLEDDNGHIDSLPTTSSNLPEQMTHSTLEQSQKHVSLSKKPFVKVHADVEMMKSFLEKLSDTITKDNVIEGQTNDIVLYNREIPYSLRSQKVISLTEARNYNNLYLRKKKSKNMSKTSQFKAGCSTTGTEQNMPDLEKVDPNFWKTLMIRFKCKDCTIPLIRCEEESKNFRQISTIMLKNSLTLQCNSMLFQESDIKNNMRFKELEVSLERLTTAASADISQETILDVKKHSDDFLCKICKKSFSSKSAKRIHIKSSHTAYMSSICDARYTLKHKLFQHYLQEHLFKSNQCCICYTLLSDYVTLKRHLNIHCLKYIQRGDDQYPVDIEMTCNSTKRIYKCLHCSKIFSTQSTLMAHQSCCTVQKETEENLKDPTEETNMFPESISETQCNENADEIIVTHNENTHSVDLYENSNNDHAENVNERRISLIDEEELQSSEDKDNQNSSVSNNVLVLEEIKTVKKPQDSEKLPESDNSTISKQNITLAQLDDMRSQVEIYPCSICGKQFHKRKNLEQHIRTFSYCVDICPICGTGFSSKTLLRTHIAAAHVPQISRTYNFHCMFCNQGFIKKYELRPHVLHLHGQQMLDTLTHDFRTNQEKSDESSTHTATCNVCNLVFETRDRYVEHRMYYYKNHSFTCSLCAQSFQGMYMFHHHNKLIHYSEEKRKSYSYICDICNEGFNHESHFHSHNMHVHSNEEILIDITKECEEEVDQTSEEITSQEINNFSTKQQKEIAQLHNSGYSCQICQLKCTDIDDLIKHRMFYSNNGDFRCDKCNRRCRTYSQLDQHKKLTHICRDVYNGHACHICGEVLETVTSLVCHKKHFHPNDIVSNKVTNICKNCGQKLSLNRGKATEHRCESNANKYRYHCLFCDMKFSNANTIQAHIAQAHIDDVLAKQAFLKSALPIINSDDIQKQVIQQLNEIDQVSSSTSSSKNNLTQVLQQSNNTLNNTLSENKIKDKTAIKSSDQSKSTLPKNDTITEKILIPAAPLINRFKTNTSISMNVVPSNESKPSTSVPVSSGSTDSRSNCGIPSTSESIAKFKVNSVSSLNRFIDKSEMFVNPSSTRPFKSVIVTLPKYWKNNGTIVPTFKAVNNYDYNKGYMCPLCPLGYPSLMFFHAHLKYAHPNSIRSDVNLQLNQTNQKAFTIECLICSRVFDKETKYKRHLRNSHTHYVHIPNSEIATKVDNANNPPTTQTNNNKGSKTPEIITIDDDNVKNISDQHTTEVAPTLDHDKQNDKIGKLRVKPFAKIIENLSTDSALKLLKSKQIVFHENPQTSSDSDNALNEMYCIKNYGKAK